MPKARGGQGRDADGLGQVAHSKALRPHAYGSEPRITPRTSENGILNHTYCTNWLPKRHYVLTVTKTATIGQTVPPGQAKPSASSGLSLLLCRGRIRIGVTGFAAACSQELLKSHRHALA